MNDRFVIIGLVLVLAAGGMMFLAPEWGTALIVAVMMSGLAIFVMRKFTDEADFVTRIFLIALVLRLAFGILVHVFDLRQFFGGDANTYDFRGTRLMEYWYGNIFANDPELLLAKQTTGSGWGMNYLVAALYTIFGRNILAAQTFCAVFGAATAPLVYFCSEKLFQNKSVSRFAAISVAVFPAFVIWSGQLLKDGLIIFLLVLAMTMVLQLQERFNYAAVVLVILSLAGIITLRFYIFYMVAIAVAGSFIIGTANTMQSVARRSIVLVLMGVSLTYMGVIRNASSDLEKYGDLDRIQNSRLDLARSAESGFGEDTDVSTAEGAITAIPIGFLYLMLAPFPWQATNMRQAISLPEVFAWWAMIPLLISGIWYSLKHRLRKAFPVMIFSLMLTLAYSIFLGNVGTAYRQRTQIQVFLFIFVGVGWTLYKERREDRKLINASRRRNMSGGGRV
jgi:hypothetical protein